MPDEPASPTESRSPTAPRPRPARSRRPRDGSTDVEQQIFAAAERLLAATPLAELRVEDIATEAMTSRRTFYAYFASKEAVVVQLAARFLAETSELVNLQRRPSETGREALRRVVQANIDLWTEHRTVLRVMTETRHQIPAIQTMWMSAIDRFADEVADDIDRQRETGEAPPGSDSRKLAALLMWSTGHCLYIAGLGVDATLPNEADIHDELLALWIGAIYHEPIDGGGHRLSRAPARPPPVV